MSDAVRRLAMSQRHQTSRHLCPECSSDRRYHKHDRCLSITKVDDAIKWCCHHCGFAGAMPLHERTEVYVPPRPKPVIISSPTEDEMERVYQWLASRGITRATAMQAGVIAGVQFVNGERRQCVGFPYRLPPAKQDEAAAEPAVNHKASQPYAVKWRALSDKAFTQSGAANTLWLSEFCDKTRPLVIAEGELDALALRQSGVEAVSVPNGAPASTVSNTTGGLKFAYLGNAQSLINDAPKVVIAVDQDDPGNVLAEELSRRIGRGKCWRALWPDGCKDANDVLIKHGPAVLKDCIDNAQPWPVKGLYDAAHFGDEVDALYSSGLVRGESTGYPDVDELYTVMPGQLCVVTGIPSMGKSSFIDQVMVNLAKSKGWRFAICSFENEPKLHIAKLCAIYMGKPFFDGVTPRMDKTELAIALDWVKEHFVFLYQGDGHQSSIEDILDRLRSAVLRYGINGAIIDPANFVDRPKDQSETEWVSDALTKLKVFNMAHDVHMWFVAHPAKVYRDENGNYPVPGGYSISGSAHWFNKADMGITVHRPDMTHNQSDIHIWKCRFSWVGKVGKASLSYDVATGRYSNRFYKAPGADNEDDDDWGL